MPSSARPTDAAVRVERLTAAQPQGVGWVPQQPDLAVDGADVLLPEEPWGTRLSAASPVEEAAPPGEGLELPATPGAAGSNNDPDLPARTVAELLRVARVDPGRRGVFALIAVGLVAAMIGGGVMLRGRPSQQPLSVPAIVGSTDATGRAEVVVDVAGKVRKPGLVRLPAGARVDDALKAAGGTLPGVSTGTLNLARKLADGEQVLVGVDPAPAPGGAAAAGAGGLLDLNAATLQDFDGLPGIGPVLADHIVAWRTEHGRFASVDQLREVSGIGEAKYASIKAKVRV